MFVGTMGLGRGGDCWVATMRVQIALAGVHYILRCTGDDSALQKWNIARDSMKTCSKISEKYFFSTT